MTDDELRSMLRTWQAPRAPGTLRARVFRRRWPSWRWFISGEIRLPVPVALAALCLLAFVAYWTARPRASSLSDFQPVQQFQPRIVRTIHEAR